MIRLVVTPCPIPTDISSAPLKFVATLDGETVTTSHQPLVDGARVLIERGYDPNEPTTMRHADKPYDSFKPMPLKYWAGRTYAEGSRPPYAIAWRRRPDAISHASDESYSERKDEKVSGAIPTPNPAKSP